MLQLWRNYEEIVSIILLTWTSNATELEQLHRFCIAHEYQSAEEKVRSADSDHSAMEEEMRKWENTCLEMSKEGKELDASIQLLEDKPSKQAKE